MVKVGFSQRLMLQRQEARRGYLRQKKWQCNGLEFPQLGLSTSDRSTVPSKGRQRGRQGKIQQGLLVQLFPNSMVQWAEFQDRGHAHRRPLICSWLRSLMGLQVTGRPGWSGRLHSPALRAHTAQSLLRSQCVPVPQGEPLQPLTHRAASVIPSFPCIFICVRGKRLGAHTLWCTRGSTHRSDDNSQECVLHHGL